jgi:hydrogenase maturation protease
LRTLLIAVGNPLRRDDGIADRVLDLLVATAAVDMRRTLQLVPEIAAEMAPFDEVIFVDASTAEGRVRLEPVAPASQGTPLAHSMGAAEVVALAQRLWGFRGDAYLCHVPGVDFGAGVGLSHKGEAHAQAAAALLRHFLTAPFPRQSGLRVRSPHPADRDAANGQTPSA